jgi:predicted MPP superfamily phosphohydrolase
MFLAFFATMLLAGHAYVWLRAVRNPRWPAIVQGLLTCVLVAGLGGVVWTMWGWRAAPYDKISPWAIATFIWLGAMFHLVVFLGAWDICRTVAWVSGKVGRRFKRQHAVPGGSVNNRLRDVVVDRNTAARAGPDAFDRRAFLARAAAVTAATATGGVTAMGLYSARRELNTPEVLVRLPRLPRALDGFRIVQICDMHLGPLLDETFARRIVKRVNELKPDMVGIVGDLVDGPVHVLERDVAPLGELRSRFGTYYVTGNHEYYSGVRPWLEFLPRLNVRVLANECIAVGDRGPGGACFDLAGIHDPAGRRFDRRNAPDIERAVAGRDPERELVLLAHQPLQVTDAVRAGAGLQLSGHTHGGQLWPFGAMVLLAQPYIAGLHRHTPDTQIYVSRGTGFWGPPMRVMAPAEITQVVLTGGDST